MITHVTGWETSPVASPSNPPPGDSPVRITGSGTDGAQPPAAAQRAARQQSADASIEAQPGAQEQPKKQEKKGFFRRLIGVFK